MIIKSNCLLTRGPLAIAKLTNTNNPTVFFSFKGIFCLSKLKCKFTIIMGVVVYSIIHLHWDQFNTEITGVFFLTCLWTCHECEQINQISFIEKKKEMKKRGESDK